MKTYQTTISKPRLVIRYEADPESPRVCLTIGLFFTKDRRYESPDGTEHPLYQIMIDASEEAKNTEDHIRIMKEKANEAFLDSSPKDGNEHDEDLHVIEIYPVVKHEHSGVVYRRGTAKGFDYSNNGFYFVTAKRLHDLYSETCTQETIEEAIDSELKMYSQWADGEVYAYMLYDENGEMVDSCCGFWCLDDIKESLPEEWKDEDLSEYML